MDISNGSLGFILNLSNEDFNRRLRESMQGVNSFNANLQGGFNQSLISVNDLAKGVAAFLTVDYATQFVSQLVKVRGEFEQLEIAFTTMLGSKEKADSLMQEIVTFAATTPFGLQSTSEATKMLLAYGESADTALDTMRKLGDIASGVGIPLKDIAYLYGTTMTQGRLYTQDLNQFLGRGIPMMDELAKILGVSKNEVKGLVEAGKVGFPEVQKVIDNLTASGSMFGGLMEAQSKSVAGQIEQLKDAVDVMFNEIGKDSQGFVTSVISGASSVVENYDKIGVVLGVLITSYGAYKAALIANSAMLAINQRLEVQNALAKMSSGTATSRATVLTLLQMKAQAALNAVMMVNPYVLAASAVIALGTAYYLLADHTTNAEKAQESYNKTQEEVKSKLDETKQKAEEYINILKDETATVYQQIEAYKALQLLKLKGFENLSQEQVQAMDVNELKKLINEANDVKGLDLQKQKLIEIENQIDSVKNQIQQMNKAQGHTGLALSDAYNKLEVLNKQYDIQLSKVNQIDRDMKFANMTLEQKKAYWESIISTTEKQIFTLSNVNTNQEQGLNLAQQVSNAFQSWDVSRLNYQLNEAQNQLIAINGQINSAIPEIKNKSYWDTKKSDATSKRDKLDPKDPRNKEEWNKLTNEINEADNALKAWSVTSTKVAKPKSIKPSKKSDDPFEIYKKQIQSVKEDYERFVNYMNSDDLVLKNSGKIQYETLSRSGATYEEFLRRLQKQLVETSNKSALQVKQLRFINDELVKVIDYNAFDKFKEGIENSISESENLLEVLGKIQEEKLKLQGNTDQISIDKIKFLDEKEIENIKKADDAVKDLIKTLTDESKPLDAINKKFDAQLFLLKNKILNANDEVDRLLNDSNSLDNSLPENADKKVQIEEKILQIRKQILIAQNAIEQSEKNREKELKNTPTNNADYNLLLKNYQDFNAQKKTIEDEFENNLKTVREERVKIQNDNELKLNQSKLDELLKQNEDTENEIVRQKKKSLSKIALEQMKSSESYMKLMTKDLDKMTIESLEKIIKDLEQMQKDPNMGLLLNEEDFKVIIDQIRKVKDEVNKAKPWKGISEGWDKLFNSKDSEDKLEGVGMLIDGMNTYFDALKQTIDMADEAIEAFGGNIDDSVKETIQHVQNIVNGVGNAIAGYFTRNYAQMVAGIVQGVVEVAKILGGSKDKRLEKRIKKQQEAVKELKRAYDELSFSIERALGGKEYSMQKDQIKNLEEQKVLMEQMIKNEEKKKKTDKNKINEWKDAIADIDRQIIEIQENIANDILQTSAKELASTLGDALAEAFGKGEDAAKSFEKVANDVLRNAVLNQLKKRFIEEELQKALDQLEKDMGVDEKGWNGLSPEEQQDFRDRIKEISQNFTEALEQYSDLFKDLVDPNENSLSGAIKGVSEETASLIAGQVNAMRLLIVEANKTRIDTNRILLQSLDRLANIDFNTKNANVILDKMYAFMQSNKDNNRSYGF